ncbi:TrkH family potassium uptake protein [Oceanobacillus kapialis]|uniref:TrkH family potassium uptake protein n=1 Tax=Oceanobacillus kapialis TaxID=481353 RepID=A0ABW5Q037_9BACI
MKLLSKFTPPQLLIIIFAISIMIGTILLKLPFATIESISWINALFTSTSAMTVTGLAVVDTASSFTLFGEMIILVLIQLGGLGIMSFAVLIAKILGKKIGIKRRLLVQQSLNQNSFGGILTLIKYLFIFSLTIELVGTILLSVVWIPEMGWIKGIYYSFFHAVSAFNNAGFALWQDSLMGYVANPIVNIGITSLFILGGIGFTVLVDIWRTRRFKKLALHTKLMLVGTFTINLAAMLVVFLLEYTNPDTLGSLATLQDKLWASYFQGVTPRTAGFNSLDIASLREPTLFFMILLMFIGGGSASTAGGIKLTSFIVILFAVVSFLRGKEELVISKRAIKQSIILRALAITFLGMLFLVAGVFILSITEKSPFLSILFEVTSAFGTVGLSMGITGSLTMAGKIVIIFIMVLGKLGPLTLAFSIAKPARTKVKYPGEEIITG